MWLVAMLVGAGALAPGSMGDGAVPRSSGPRGAAVFPATNSWYAFTRTHLVIGRGNLTLWRSPGPGWSAAHIGVVVAGRRMVAFQYHHRLYVGRVHGAVRPVAQRELPLGVTSGGLYTYSYPRRELLLRGPAGHLRRVISPLPFRTDPFVARGRLFFVLRGALISAHGAHVRRLESLASLGMPVNTWVQPAGGLLELQDYRRLVVLRPDGSVFAWTPLPRHDGEMETISSSVVADPRGLAVAFTATYGESTDPSATARARGAETMYLLREGARGAVPVHTEHVRFRACERGAGVQWRGRGLLYDNSEGNQVLIDSAGTHRAIGLSAGTGHSAGSEGGV